MKMTNHNETMHCGYFLLLPKSKC